MSSKILRRNKLLNAAGTIIVLGLGTWVVKSLLICEAYAESSTQLPQKIFSGFFGQSLRLENAENVNHNTKRLRFAFPNPEAQSGLTLTSSVLTLTWPQSRWFPVLRPYTPISSLDEPGTLELLVKRYPDGKASGYLHSLSPGSTLFFLTALKGYTWTPNAFPHIIILAGGAGITPIYQLARGILQNPSDKTKITLVHGINSDTDLLLKEEFEDFERRFPGRFRRVITVSNPVEGSTFRKGYVNRTLLEDVIGDGKRSEEKVFVCGPPAMEKALTGKQGVLEDLGYKKDQIYKF